MLRDDDMQIVALARLCGVKGSDREILGSYYELYNAIKKSEEGHEPGTVEVEIISRPF